MGSELKTTWDVHAPTVKVTLPDLPEDASVEERLDLLERRARQLEQRDNDLTRALIERDRERNKLMAAESAARNEAIARLAQRVRDHAAGGLRLEACGLAGLFVGVTFGTVPDVVVTVLRALTPLP